MKVSTDMNYKEIKLRAKSPEAAATEIMYEIAACRADRVELIRFNISYVEEAEEVNTSKKILAAVLKLLRNMKQKGSVQFIATPESFAAGSTESRFLYNKFPSIFDSTPSANEGETFVFVKI